MNAVWDYIALLCMGIALASPVIALFVVSRYNTINIPAKVITGIIITIGLFTLFGLLSISIVFRNGAGPDSVYQ